MPSMANSAKWNASCGTRRGAIFGDWQQLAISAHATSPRHFIRDDWAHLSSPLLRHADGHWSVWIDWYEAQLAGPAGLLEREEVARVSLPNDVWAQGAAFANMLLRTLRVVVRGGRPRNVIEWRKIIRRQQL